MAVVKVFSAGGIKELRCFDTLDNVDYLTPDEEEVFDYETLPDFETE